MSIKYQWQTAKNEFGSQAFKRFDSAVFALESNHVIENMFSVILHDDEDDNNDYLCFNPLRDLWAHDDSFYIDAFAMWQWRYVDGSNDWTDCNKTLSFKADKEYRRKDSAGLPFDFNRAIKSSPTECLHGGMWKKCEVIRNNTDDEYIEVFIFSEDIRKWYLPHDLRMKYPPRKAL